MNDALCLRIWVVGGLCVTLTAGCTSGRLKSGSTHATMDRAEAWHFDDSAVGEMPAGWEIRQTNPTKSLASWAVIEDPTSPSGHQSLALTATENYNGTYNLAIAEQTRFGDFTLSVSAKAVRGDEDQGGGPIWRCQDADNYYICRFNPLEGNFRVYVVSNGKRKQLDSARMHLEPSQWYTMDVSMLGDKITCSLNGKKLLEASDSTLPDPGMVGLWTKADAVTSFDDLSVVTMPSSR